MAPSNACPGPSPRSRVANANSHLTTPESLGIGVGHDRYELSVVFEVSRLAYRCGQALGHVNGIERSTFTVARAPFAAVGRRRQGVLGSARRPPADEFQ